MPSLFSRSHQAPKKDRAPAVLVNNATGGDRRLLGISKTWNGLSVTPSNSVGEFGTVPSMNMNPARGATPVVEFVDDSQLQCSFLTTHVPIHSQSILSNDTLSEESTRPYGFLGGVGRNVVLGLDEVARVIRDVGAELQRRALDTPMLFSNQSLELNQTRMRTLIQTFLGTVRTTTRTPTKTSQDTFMQDIQFASDHELAWLLRWVLSRMTRLRESTREVCHGCIDWEQYEEWRGRERASKYPPDAFNILPSIVAVDIYSYIVNPLFSLLAKFAAHSHNSGLTPHALASYFAPLLFDIPTTASCMVAHTAYVRAAAGTEHMLLAYIRSSGDGNGLGVTDLPFRLKEWIKGYPAMISSDADLARGKPRRGARVVKCEVATRSVRAYSRDLILNAETWVNDIPGGWDSWDRVVLKTRRGDGSRPRFSPAWRRKMAVKETLPLPQSRGHGERIVYGMPRSQHDKSEEDGDAGRFGSLAGKEWNAFEEGGFDAPRTSVGSRETVQQNGDIRSRLQFDLNESAKQSVAERRQTMDWTDFADGGFTRTEPFLTASLTFSAPVQTSITEWPKERDELRRRLQKTQKEATPFTHDTTPRVGLAANMEGADMDGRVCIEEAFVDCWSDFMMGSSWTDRDELTFKESAWALIEYKARPSKGDLEASGGDPRTSELYFMFDERVPLDYQMAVADPKRKKTLHQFFKKKKAGSTSPGTPFSPRNDFDKMLNQGTQKKLSLARADQSVSSNLWTALNDSQIRLVKAKPGSTSASPSPNSPVPPPKPAKSPSTSPLSPPFEEVRTDDPTKLGNGKPRLFKSIRRVKSGNDQRARRQQQREVSMDFEIQSASGMSSGTSSPNDQKSARSPPEEKWMDILIANGARKMDRDDQTPTQTSPSEGPNARMARKVSPPSPVSAGSETATPTATHFNNPGLGLLSPPTDRRSSAGSHNSSRSHPNSFQGSFESIHEAQSRAVPDDSYLAYERHSHGSANTSYSTVDDGTLMPNDSASMRNQSYPSPPDSPVTALTPPPHSSLSASNSYEGLISPRPRIAGERDAIVSIVDHYGDSGNRDALRDSRLTDDSDPYGGMARESFIEHTYASERVNSAYSIADDLREPPPIFDLTPGREPSPARYRHGEPLHFVGEEEEDDY